MVAIKTLTATYLANKRVWKNWLSLVLQMWRKRVKICHKTKCTWTAYRLSTGCRRRARRQPSQHEPPWESGDTKVGGYQRDRSRLRPRFLNVFGSGGWGGGHGRSPVEGSVRLVLEHLVKVFQRLHLTCCLAGENTESVNLSRTLEWRISDAGWHTNLGVREPTCHCGIRENFCKTKIYIFRVFFSSPLSTVILRWDQPRTFKWVLVTWWWVYQHEFGPVLQQDLVVLSHCLLVKVGDELVLHKAWTGHQDALYH